MNETFRMNEKFPLYKQKRTLLPSRRNDDQSFEPNWLLRSGPGRVRRKFRRGLRQRRRSDDSVGRSHRVLEAGGLTPEIPDWRAQVNPATRTKIVELFNTSRLRTGDPAVPRKLRRQTSFDIGLAQVPSTPLALSKRHGLGCIPSELSQPRMNRLRAAVWFCTKHFTIECKVFSYRP
jgi:hypothetical protein